MGQFSVEVPLPGSALSGNQQCGWSLRGCRRKKVLRVGRLEVDVTSMIPA